jgi:hypothetical protein
MASLVLAGDTSGSITVSAPAVAGSNTQTLQAATGTVALTSDVIGLSQTWQSVTRTSGVTYTNTTGKPINVLSQATAGGATVDTWTVGGVALPNIVPGAATNSVISFIVPVGATYSHVTAGTINVFELR